MPTLNLQVNANNENARNIFNNGGGFSNFTFGFGGWYSPGGLSFDIPDINSGDTIDSATFQIRSRGAYGQTTITIYGEDADNGQTFDVPLGSLIKTTASVSWSPNFAGGNIWYTSAELKTILQEIVDRTGWSAGNRATFQLGDEDQGVNILLCWSYYNSPTYAPKLDIDYTINLAPATCRVSAVVESIVLGSVVITPNAISYVAGQVEPVVILSLITKLFKTGGRQTLFKTGNRQVVFKIGGR